MVEKEGGNQILLTDVDPRELTKIKRTSLHIQSTFPCTKTPTVNRCYEHERPETPVSRNQEDFKETFD